MKRFLFAALALLCAAPLRAQRRVDTLAVGDSLVIQSISVVPKAAPVVAPPPVVTPPPVVAGAFNEPVGYTTVVNSGPITVAPPCGAAATTFKAGINTWTVWSTNVTSAYGENCANLQRVTDGPSGLRVVYPSNTKGGNSPVRFGTGFSAVGTGNMYVRYRERVEAGWTSNGNMGAKNFEPRTPASNGGGSAGGTGQNDVLGFSSNGGGGNAWLQFLQQGSSTTDLPCWEYCRAHGTGAYGVPMAFYADSGADLAHDHQWHTVEWLVTVNSPLGTANGCLSLWIDSRLEWKECDVKWFIAGNTAAWNYFMSDPTYGGGTNSPPAGGVAWDFDQVYISVK